MALMTDDTLQLSPLAPALGAEIDGVDLSRTLDDGAVSEIRRALLQYGVVFFRDQNITPAEHIAFAKRFGDLVDYPMVDGLAGHPEIVPVARSSQVAEPLRFHQHCFRRHIFRKSRGRLHNVDDNA